MTPTLRSIRGPRKYAGTGLIRTAAAPISPAHPSMPMATDGCEKAGACVIGHIKAFTELPDGYARASAVDTKHAPTSDARASAPSAAVDLTVNVLVYGLPAEAARHVAEDSLARVAASERITISTIGEERDQG